MRFNLKQQSHSGLNRTEEGEEEEAAEKESGGDVSVSAFSCPSGLDQISR